MRSRARVREERSTSIQIRLKCSWVSVWEKKNDENHFQTIVHRPYSSMSLALLFSPVHDKMHNMYQINDYAHKFSLSRLAFESLQIKGGRRKQIQIQRTNKRRKKLREFGNIEQCLPLHSTTESICSQKQNRKKNAFCSTENGPSYTEQYTQVCHTIFIRIRYKNYGILFALAFLFE